MNFRLIAIAVLLCGAVRAEITHLTVQDPQGLAEAIHEANAQPAVTTDIRLVRGDYLVHEDFQFPAISGDVVVRGASHSPNGHSRIVGGEERSRTLFIIEAGGTAEFHEIEIRDIFLDSEEPLIANGGTLILSEFKFDSVLTRGIGCSGFGPPCHDQAPLILNAAGAHLQLGDVSFIDSGDIGSLSTGKGGVLHNMGHAELERVQVFLTPRGTRDWFTPIHNWGSLRIVNSSFKTLTNRHFSPLVKVHDGSDAEIVNSIVSGYGWCDDIVSLGSNINDSPHCTWSAEGDLVGIDPGLIWRPYRSLHSYPFSHALVPTPASPAVGTGIPEYCPRGQPCSRGAFEPENNVLDEGGINGLFYNPDADGHYIQVLQTDFHTLLIWNTVDKDGTLTWVHGIGQLTEGNALQTETYINRGVKINPGEGESEVEAEYWGVINLEMFDCVNGYISYVSELPEFGEGQFPIRRLANVKQLGCVDAR